MARSTGPEPAAGCFVASSGRYSVVPQTITWDDGTPAGAALALVAAGSGDGDGVGGGAAEGASCGRGGDGGAPAGVEIGAGGAGCEVFAGGWAGVAVWGVWPQAVAALSVSASAERPALRIMCMMSAIKRPQRARRPARAFPKEQGRPKMPPVRPRTKSGTNGARRALAGPRRSRA